MRTFITALAALIVAAHASAQMLPATSANDDGVDQNTPAVGEASTAPSSAPPLLVVPDWGTRYQNIDEDERKTRWIVGAEVNTKPDYFGRSGRGYGLRPVLAVEWGRFHASTGGGHSLMGQGRERNSARGGSIEGTLRATDRFNVSLGMNIDRGRSGASSERLRTAPKIPTTARLRVKARYFLGQRWTASVSGSQDILGKHGGLKGDLRLSYEYPMSQVTTIIAAAGASFGNGAYMRSQFGIPDSPQYGFRPFRAKAGLFQSDLSIDVAHAISRRWVAFGGIGYSHLHGDAKRSPMTLHSNGMSVSLGVAWRN